MTGVIVYHIICANLCSCVQAIQIGLYLHTISFTINTTNYSNLILYGYSFLNNIIFTNCINIDENDWKATFKRIRL